MKIKYVDLLSGNLPPGFRDYHEVMRAGTMSRDGQYIEIGEEPTSKITLQAGRLRYDPQKTETKAGEHSTLNIQHSTSKAGKYQSLLTSSPTNNAEWPAWAKALGTQRIEGEVGVGDTANRLLHSPGVGILADGIVAGLALFGRKCGCTRRQNEWNRRYAYSAMTNDQALMTSGNHRFPH